METTTPQKAQTFARYFLYFFCYCVIGWLYEVFLEVVVYRWGFSNRGVLFGPYLPVYGVGALVFLLTVYRLLQGKSVRRKLLLIPVVFLCCALLATAIELAASYLCEWTLGHWPWQTYARDYTIQFQGRIALSPSIRFGLGGVLFLYVLQPLFEKMVGAMGPKVRQITATVLLCIMIADAVVVILRRILG